MSLVQQGLVWWFSCPIQLGKWVLLTERLHRYSGFCPCSCCLSPTGLKSSRLLWSYLYWLGLVAILPRRLSRPLGKWLHRPSLGAVRAFGRLTLGFHLHVLDISTHLKLSKAIPPLKPSSRFPRQNIGSSRAARQLPPAEPRRGGKDLQSTEANRHSRE